MKRGYARVSTTGQDLQSQITRLNEEGCEVIYSEKFTGTNANRTEFQRLLGDLEDSDTLVVTKLDRLSIAPDFYQQQEVRMFSWTFSSN